MEDIFQEQLLLPIRQFVDLVQLNLVDLYELHRFVEHNSDLLE